MAVFHINGVPVYLSQVDGRFVASVGVFGLVTLWGKTAGEVLGEVARLLTHHERQSAA